MMPNMDGSEVCRRLRNDGDFERMKVILVSAKTILSEHLEGYQCGADDFITKPFDHGQLHAKVNVFLRLKTAVELTQVVEIVMQYKEHDAP